MNEDFYKHLLDNLYDGVYFVDNSRKITYWNQSAERITGFKKEDIVGKYCFQNTLQHINSKGKKICYSGCPLQETLKTGEIKKENDLFLHHKNGYRVPIYTKSTPIRDLNGEIIGAVEIFNVLSAQKEVENRIKELEKKLTLDNLTKIPNREYMESLIDSKISAFKQKGDSFATLFIDIDNFKLVNDTYGHNIGDEVLKIVSKTLVNNIRSTDMVARWGGEEFIVLLSDLDYRFLKTVLSKFIILIRNSEIRSEEYNFKITVSIGATVVKNEDSLKSIVDRADKLMYESKKGGKDRFTIG